MERAMSAGRTEKMASYKPGSVTSGRIPEALGECMPQGCGIQACRDAFTASHPRRPGYRQLVVKRRIQSKASLMKRKRGQVHENTLAASQQDDQPLAAAS